MNGYLRLSANNVDKNLAIHDIYLNESFTDVTLVTDDGQHVKAHKVILASVSDVLRKMLEKFDGEPSSQSIFFIRGVKYQNLASLLDFIYKGEASVHFQMLGDFMSLAKDLNVSGLFSCLNISRENY